MPSARAGRSRTVCRWVADRPWFADQRTGRTNWSVRSDRQRALMLRRHIGTEDAGALARSSCCGDDRTRARRWNSCLASFRARHPWGCYRAANPGRKPDARPNTRPRHLPSIRQSVLEEYVSRDSPASSRKAPKSGSAGIRTTISKRHAASIGSRDDNSKRSMEKLAALAVSVAEPLSSGSRPRQSR